ncbi:MAG: hypothetical protein ACKV0T_24665 [Planctomycetales bacterium]
MTLFLFGTVSTAGIWIYWKLHLAPFLPLQRALANAFPESLPRVDGGWARNEFRKGPPRLRILLRVPFPPDRPDDRVEETVKRVIELAREHVDFTAYDELEIYLVQHIPERTPRQYEYKVKMAELAGGG